VFALALSDCTRFSFIFKHEYEHKPQLTQTNSKIQDLFFDFLNVLLTRNCRKRKISKYLYSSSNGIWNIENYKPDLKKESKGSSFRKNEKSIKQTTTISLEKENIWNFFFLFENNYNPNFETWFISDTKECVILLKYMKRS
jgi:hypothetical protein